MQEYYEAIMAAAKACSDKPLSDKDMEAIVNKFANCFTKARKDWIKLHPAAPEGVEGDAKPKKKGGAPKADMGITWAALSKSFGNAI